MTVSFVRNCLRIPCTLYPLTPDLTWLALVKVSRRLAGAGHARLALVKVSHRLPVGWRWLVMVAARLALVAAGCRWSMFAAG